MTNFYIVRHGQTDWNVQQVLQGQKDIPLNSKGIEQANALAEELKSIKFSQIFSSDLSRASKTAEILADKFSLPIQKTNRLRERKFSNFEGQHINIYRDFRNQKLGTNASFDQLLNFKVDQDYESDAEIIKRVFNFLQDIQAKNSENVLIVTHSGVMSRILIYLKLLSYSSDHRKIDNLGYFILSRDDQGFKFKSAVGIKGL